jgi:hypothetical protein
MERVVLCKDGDWVTIYWELPSGNYVEAVTDPRHMPPRIRRKFGASPPDAPRDHHEIDPQAVMRQEKP